MGFAKAPMMVVGGGSDSAGCAALTPGSLTENPQESLIRE
jgi:hypothetical protein